MELLTHLLPVGPLHLDTWHLNEATAQLTLRVTSTQSLGHCPVCQFPTRRIHSHYARTVADLPWATYRVVLQLNVRKFFCANGRCRRRVFTERLPQLVAPWARRTQRLAQWLAPIAVALGGTAGARLSHGLSGAVSRNTLLRVVRRLPLPTRATPTVLGVDDWAYRKRQTYGTILIDLERHHPVALLPDRDAGTLAQWLTAHPGVQIIARDRAKAYADGARQGAPQATQVADRFHLMQNVAEALEQVCSAHSQALTAVSEAMRQTPIRRPDGSMALPIPPPPPAPTAQELATQRRARRLALYEQVWALHRQGWSGEAIARQLGMGRATVFRYLHTPTFPERQGRCDRGTSLLNAYKDYLVQRWNAGCRDTRQLCAEIRPRGYRGSYPTVARYTQRLRQIQGMTPRQRLIREPLPAVSEPRQPPLTARRAAWLVLRREDQRTAGESQQLTQLRAQQSELAEAIALTEDFAQLVRQRQGAQLDPWLERAAKSTLGVFQRFAQGLRDDYAAVKAGMTLPWSTGPVEGHINRLKMLKRQMFGRARLDLLSRRFLLAPRQVQGHGQHSQKPAETPAPPAAA
jgi:transposase